MCGECAVRLSGEKRQITFMQGNPKKHQCLAEVGQV